MMAKDNNQRKGQAMIIAVLALGGVILGVTTVAGFLTLYQLRQATDVESSARSIFAADAGTEWALYSYYHPPEVAPAVFSNGAVATVTCYDASGVTVVSCDSTSTVVSAISKGSAGNTKRAFFLQFVGSSFAYP